MGRNLDLEHYTDKQETITRAPRSTPTRPPRGQRGNRFAKTEQPFSQCLKAKRKRSFWFWLPGLEAATMTDIPETKKGSAVPRNLALNFGTVIQ